MCFKKNCTLECNNNVREIFLCIKECSTFKLKSKLVGCGNSWNFFYIYILIPSIYTLVQHIKNEFFLFVDKTIQNNLKLMLLK